MLFILPFDMLTYNPIEKKKIYVYKIKFIVANNFTSKHQVMLVFFSFINGTPAVLYTPKIMEIFSFSREKMNCLQR